MSDASPMERAVRALGNAVSGDGPEGVEDVWAMLDRLVWLKGQDPDAFAAVLAECGFKHGVMHVSSCSRDQTGEGDCTEHCHVRFTAPLKGSAYFKPLRVVSEGQALIEGRVVELEPKTRWHSDPGRCNHHEHDGPSCRNPDGEWTQLYRVKPERNDRHTEGEGE